MFLITPQISNLRFFGAPVDFCKISFCFDLSASSMRKFEEREKNRKIITEIVSLTADDLNGDRLQCRPLMPKEKQSGNFQYFIYYNNLRDFGANY